MDKKRIIALILLFAILFIFSISLIAVGATVHNQLIRHFNLNETTCTPTTRRLVGCTNGNWIVVWNENMIEDVYATRPTKELAIANTNDYNVNQTYPCMCNLASSITTIGIDCDTWKGACYFNMNATRNIVQTQMVYKYGSDACLSVGSLIFLAMIIVLGVLIYKKRSNTGDHFVLVAEGE